MRNTFVFASNIKREIIGWKNVALKTSILTCGKARLADELHADLFLVFDNLSKRERPLCSQEEGKVHYLATVM
jgi:hypothetical protein